MKNNKGMTLIEIMIVLVILGGLMTVLGANVIDNKNKADVKQAKMMLHNISSALQLYSADCGKLPTTEQGLDALLSDPGSCDNWGPTRYIKPEQLKDPWKNEVTYESDGNTYTLVSLGSDGRPGGEKYAKDLELTEE